MYIKMIKCPLGCPSGTLSARLSDCIQLVVFVFFSPVSLKRPDAATVQKGGVVGHVPTSDPSPGVPLASGQEIVLRMKKIISLAAQPVTTFLHQVIYNKT